MHCLVCGTETLNPKFCSRSCAALTTTVFSLKEAKVRLVVVVAILTLEVEHTTNLAGKTTWK